MRVLSSCNSGYAKLRRKTLTLFAVTAMLAIAVFAFFGVQTVATAGEGDNGNTTCEQLPAVEEMLPLRDTLTSQSATSLSMTCDEGLSSSNATTSGDGASTQATTARITMYRLYNKYTGEHFYTSNATEKNNLVKASWTYEGVGWYAPKTSKTPVYRLYNPYVSGGDHHYTTNSSELTTLKNAGWKDEGIGWYSTDAGEIDRVPLYRQYNPFAQTGTHNYTQSKSENDKLIKAGWKAEGTGWFGYSKSTPTIQALDFSKISVTTTAKTYNGKAQTQTVKSSVYKLNTDYTVTYSNNKNAGTATIVVKGKGLYTGSKTYKFTINKLNISNATVTLGTALTYNAKEQTQTIKSVKVGSLTLSTSDYTVSNNKRTEANSYTLKVTGKGNFKGIATKVFSIEQATPEFDLSKTVEGKIGHNLSEVDLSSYTKIAGAFTIQSTDVQMTEVGKEYTFKATFTPNDQNYKTVSGLDLKVKAKGLGYWLGTAGANETFVDEEYFAKNDVNYRSGLEIASDMAVLHDSKNENYSGVKTTWVAYYDNADSATAGKGNQIRLYATYDGGENEGSYDTTSEDHNQGAKSEKNKFVEFRILEVSGAGGHKLHDGTTSDGSAVTFMATHVLPTAYEMNTEGKNEGGWRACQLYKDMNEVSGTEGKIYEKFSDDFVSQVKAVKKEYNTGGSGSSQTATLSTVDCQFWIPSYTELVSSTASSYPSWMPKLEGMQYAWCAKNVANATSRNSCLAFTTRGGATPGSCNNSNCYWWERSPNVSSTNRFGIVYGDGTPGSTINANYYFGVVPAFSF